MPELLDEMQVVKRAGSTEDVSFDKILNRLKALGRECEPPLALNYADLVMRVADQLYSGIATSAIDELTAQQCAAMSTTHLSYGVLAGRIVISNCHKTTPKSFGDAMKRLYYAEDQSGQHSALISKELWLYVHAHADQLEALIDYSRDYKTDYFGFKTLERAYLMRDQNGIVERPQHMWLRVAVAIHMGDMDRIKETYDLMSMQRFTHATPTLFNAGTPRQQMSSCYLLGMEADSIDGIYGTLSDCARISKWAGGIGLHIHNIRATGSHIRGTNGKSNGLVPMLQVFDRTARYVDQGGGKRNGSFAVYLEPWHGDIESFLDLKKNHGDEDLRARDLFYGLWIPDLFMQRVKDDGDWTLFCPDRAPGLADSTGSDFVRLYESYEEANIGMKTIKARELWLRILDSQMETGTPYMLYKDACNRKSNQKNLGVIKSSNLCTEIIEFSNQEETAVCNLASISLSCHAKEGGEYNYEKLHEVAEIVARNLDKIIDLNYYPTPKTRISNLRHRPIGIGIQGMADALAIMGVPFDSDEAALFNRRVFETIYHAAISTSCKLAQERVGGMRELWTHIDNGATLFASDEPASRQYCQRSERAKELIEILKPIPEEFQHRMRSRKADWVGTYSTFNGSPASSGQLQYDLWQVDPEFEMWDWTSLKQAVDKYGLRNSLSIAPMPTASTSQILGNNECFEPFTSNIYSRRTLAGDYIVVNKHLMRDLEKLGLWSPALKDQIVRDHGSIQKVHNIPEELKHRYKTVWEMPMKRLIDMAADRGPFICQSQSLNLWLEDPNYDTLTSMHFYAWQKGLKTGIYYLRRKPKHQPQQFSIEPDSQPCEMCSA